MKIGPYQLNEGLVLPAIAGYSDPAFRALCRRYGAELTCTEMVSAKGLNFANETSRRLLTPGQGETPAWAQIFGADPEEMARAAAGEYLRPFGILDLNFGCPVPKIVNNGEGSALLRTPAEIGRIVRAVVRAVPDKTVTVKMRLGFEKGHYTAVDAARYARDAGAAAVTVHGRTREDYYAGKADLSGIAAVKEAVDIPVIGNGDVTDRASYLAMRATGVDGVAIARGALGRPWVFALVRGLTPEVDVAAIFAEHVRTLLTVYPEARVVAEMKKHVAAYARGQRGGKAWKMRAFEARTAAQLLDSVHELAPA